MPQPLELPSEPPVPNALTFQAEKQTDSLLSLHGLSNFLARPRRAAACSLSQPTQMEAPMQ